MQSGGREGLGYLTITQSNQNHNKGGEAKFRVPHIKRGFSNTVTT